MGRRNGDKDQRCTRVCRYRGALYIIIHFVTAGLILDS